MIRRGSELVSWRSHAGRSKWFAAGAGVGICAIFCTAPAFAYRPFDGTDAAVADVGEVEIELQPIGAMRAGSTTKGISDSVLNFGFADRWEFVLQGTAQAPPEGGGPLSVPDAAFCLKDAVRPGVLQDKPGAEHGNGVWPSIAGRGWFGRRFQLEWHRLATVAMGQTRPAGTWRRTLHPTSMANSSSTPLSRDRTSGKSDRFLRFTPTVSSTNRKHSRV